MPNLSFLDKDQNGQTTFCQDLPFLKFEKSLWNCLAEICKYHVYIRQIIYLLLIYSSIYNSYLRIAGLLDRTSGCQAGELGSIPGVH